ncbi:MAG TPA: FecR domain-containing protein [Planctomicrobium sp.]|nr:FecR domain-containing protein [Planctomicrobium sp.]
MSEFLHADQSGQDDASRLPAEGQDRGVTEQISALIDGAVDRETFQRLQERLRQDAASRRQFIHLMLLDADLADEFSTESVGGMVDVLSTPLPKPVSPIQRHVEDHSRGSDSVRRSWIHGGITLATVLLVCGSLFWWNRSSAPPVAESRSALAQVVRISDSSLEPEFRAGQKLEAGTVRLMSGVVEIRIQSGVTALLEGPVELEILDPMQARLVKGRALFRVPPPAIGFTCRTANASVIDLGTEFGVYAGEESGTEVQVYEGEVIAGAAAAMQQQSGQRVQSGQAVLIRGDGLSEPEEIQFLPDRFRRYLPDPKDPHDPDRTSTGIYNDAQHEELRIVPTSGNVVIDGSLEDWNLSGEFVSRCRPPFETFYHLRGAAMYDDQYLYIAANVGDPFPMRSTVSPHIKRDLYGNGGCLAFRISTDRRMGWPIRGLAPGVDRNRQLLPDDVNEKLVFLILWYYEPERLPCLHVKYGMDEHDRKVNPPGYEGAFRKWPDGLGYTAEYRIPWSLLSAEDAPPQAGDVLGWTWLVHWSGPEGRNWKGQLIDISNPKETGWNFHRAATWGKAVYTGRNP